jgi:hypothetical protein
MSDVQQVYSTLLEIDKLLDGIEVKIETINGQVSGSSAGSGGGVSDGGGNELSMRQQIRTLNMMGMILEQMTGDKNVNKAVQKFSQLMMVLMRLRMLLFVVSELEAGVLGGPWGWMYAIANAVGFGVSLQTLGQ